MKASEVMGIYFSPTGHTREIVYHIAEAVEEKAKLLDLTSNEMSNREYFFDKEELAVIGTPVYGGRIPALAAERLKCLHGENTPAVVFVTYGNRDYDDALLELKNVVEESNFRVIAAAAVVTEHSIFPTVGQDRPDMRDWDEINKFIDLVREKVETHEEETWTEFAVKGKTPYKKYNGIPLKPKASKACVKCGFCARECPANAIPAEDPSKTDHKKCISCMRCVTYCPQQARSVNKLLYTIAQHKLEKACNARRANEFMI